MAAVPSASSERTVYVGGDRPVAVIVPPGYDAGRPAPLLIVLHGYGSSGHEHDLYFHIGELAAERGYLYVHPDGTYSDDGNRFWNATDACCDFDRKGVDDAAYLAGVITDIEASFAVDPKRIDVLGHSNGGFMSYALSCAHADTIAAMASLAGATFVKPADCAPTSPVAVLEIHGTADDTILFKGGTIDLGPGTSMAPYPGAETSVATWAKYDGCSQVVGRRRARRRGRPRHRQRFPRRSDRDALVGLPTRRGRRTLDGPGGGHGPDISDAFPAAVLDFFEAHPKP